LATNGCRLHAVMSAYGVYEILVIIVIMFVSWLVLRLWHK
jgi:hypothetical protein